MSGILNSMLRGVSNCKSDVVISLEMFVFARHSVRTLCTFLYNHIHVPFIVSEMALFIVLQRCLSFKMNVSTLVK